LYINLDNRPDRRDEIKKELTTVPDHLIHRIRAIYDADCGHIGCGRSHIVALQFAIDNGWDSVLILEDDFYFETDMKFLNQSLVNLPCSWDVFMLAGAYVDSTPVRRTIEKVKRATTASGYIVRKHYYQTLLACFQEAVFRMEMDLNEFRKTNPSPKKMYTTDNAIDQYWFGLQESGNWYISNPRVGSQGRSSSSIMS
jgi:GR25 family glycosyltransferase involved in LPS biosynthesis